MATCGRPSPIRRTADRLPYVLGYVLGPQGSAHLIAACAAPLTITVICDLPGIPTSRTSAASLPTTARWRRSLRAGGLVECPVTYPQRVRHHDEYEE